MNQYRDMLVLGLIAIALAGCTATPQIDPNATALNTSNCSSVSANKSIQLDSPCAGIGSGSAFKFAGRIKNLQATKIQVDFFDASGQKFDTEAVTLTPSVAASDSKDFSQNIDLNATASSYKITSVDTAGNTLDTITVDLTINAR